MAKIHELNSDGSVKRNFKGIKWAVIGIAVIIIAAASLTIVPAGNTGVLLTLGKVSETSFQEGAHFKIPFVQTVGKYVKQNSGL